MKSTPNPEQISEEAGRGRRRGAVGGLDLQRIASSDEILLVGARFETPAKVPFLISGRYRRLPGFLREWLRAAFGMGTLLFEKMSANKNQAFIDLLGHVQRQQEQLDLLGERLAALEGRGGGKRSSDGAGGPGSGRQRGRRRS